MTDAPSLLPLLPSMLPLLIVLLILGTAAPVYARSPLYGSRPPAPDGTPVCTDWVHAGHAVRARRADLADLARCIRARPPRAAGRSAFTR